MVFSSSVVGSSGDEVDFRGGGGGGVVVFVPSAGLECDGELLFDGSLGWGGGAGGVALVPSAGLGCDDTLDCRGEGVVFRARQSDNECALDSRGGVVFISSAGLGCDDKFALDCRGGGRSGVALKAGASVAPD